MGGAEYVSEKRNQVEFWWGGALEGHWGVFIGLNWQPVQQDDPFETLYPAAPDVAFVNDAN